MTAATTDSGFTGDDRAFMRTALGLARRGLGRTSPNPTVGCVLVRPDLGQRVVGRGWTRPGGRPHAETEALNQAGPLARGAHAYVTLEPCSHTGKTPPCADALIAAGVAAVTVATSDPDPRVNGQGMAKLTEAGVAVRAGLLQAEARAINAGFLSVKERGRPWVTLKTATTLDGAIAAHTGASQWITGPAARARGHLLRAQNDAVITGIGTVKADDPLLTCRLPGLEDRSPIRVVIDAMLETPADGALAGSAGEIPVWVVTGNTADPARAAALTAAGCDVIPVDIRHTRPDPAVVLAMLAERGMTRVLVEAGAGVSGAFVEADVVDEISWFRAPAIMGGDGLMAFAAWGLDAPAQAPRFRHVETLSLDDDVLERYLRT